VSVMVGVVDGLALHGLVLHGGHGRLDTRHSAVTLSGRGAPVYTCTCVHDKIPCRRLL